MRLYIVSCLIIAVLAEYEVTFLPDGVTKESILEDYNLITNNNDEKSFGGSTMAYITPWNSFGYDLAKWSTTKLDVVSPVWLQLKPALGSGDSCRITGQHDIDHGWIEELKKKNSNVKVTPRIIFEEFNINSITDLMRKDALSNRCINDVINMLQRNELDGAVFEMWSMTMGVSQGSSINDLTEFVQFIGKQFHKKDLTFIVAVHAPLDGNSKPTHVFTPEHLAAIAPHVDFVNVMAYDFQNGREPHGPAPLYWVEDIINYVLGDEPSSDVAKKIMIGLNFYGYHFSRKGFDHVLNNKFLEILKQPESQLVWDNADKEHRLMTSTDLIFYPTLTSIELRLQLADKYGLSVAIWEYGQGLSYFSQLL